MVFRHYKFYLFFKLIGKLHFLNDISIHNAVLIHKHFKQHT